MPYKQPPFSDDEMINGIKNDDNYVLTLMKGYFTPRIRGMVWKKGTDSNIIPQRVEAVYNEALVRVKYKLDNEIYQHCQKFCGFFMSVAKFVDTEFFRKMVKKQQEDRLWEDQAYPDNPNSNDMDNYPVAEEDMEDDRSELIALCLDALPPNDRKLMDLFYRQGYNLIELAKQFGTTHNAIKARICRIRQRIRVKFEELDDRMED